MALAVVFSAALVVAVLISDLARHSILSTAALFVVVGFGAGALGWVQIAEHSRLLESGAEVALLATLFTDGLKLDVSTLRAHWRLAARALALGLPLTLLFTAVLARWLLALDWTRALLVGATLAPTDPVFASSLIGSEHVPVRLRRLLNIESGLNDGLSVPFVIVLIGAASGRAISTTTVLLEVAGGLALGALMPLPAAWLIRRHPFGATEAYRPLFALGILLLCVSVAHALGWNALLAAFAAGVVLGTVSERARHSYETLGDNASELLKLGALLVFAASIEPPTLLEIGWRGYAFAASALLLPRMLAMMLALVGSDLDRPTRIAAAWIGPRGFAPVLFGLLVLHSSVPERVQIFHVIAVVVVASILLHSSTDHYVERRFERAELATGQ